VADGSRTVVTPDGTTIATLSGSDPRFGQDAAFLGVLRETLPSGKMRETKTTRTAQFITPGNSLGVKSFEQLTVTNGNQHRVAYDATTGAIGVQTAGGLVSTLIVDPVTQLPRSSKSDPAVAARTYTYDASRRLTGTAFGDQASTLTYDAAGHVASIASKLGDTVALTWDGADHVTTIKTPLGRVASFGYDAAGNRTRVTTPSGEAHIIGFTAGGIPWSYGEPGGAVLTTSFDKDELPTVTTFPSGRGLTRTFDGGRRLTTEIIGNPATPEATITSTFSDATARPSSSTRTPTAGNGSAQTTSFTYDGQLVTSMTSTGAANGVLAYQYDASFQLSAFTFDGNTTAIVRDADGRPTKVGRWQFTRGRPFMRPSSIGDGGSITVGFGYDALGRESTRTENVAGSPVYAGTSAFDAAGRLATRSESLLGTSRALGYTYDADGRLTAVTQGGVPSESYTYDANGNVTSRSSFGVTTSVTFDKNDRVTSAGGVAYAYDADGFLSGRGSDTFAYDVRGELLRATVGGTTVSYDYDAAGRRVARREGARTTEYFYLTPTDVRVAFTRDSVVGVTQYFYDDAHRLFAIERGGSRYAVVTDAVGSPLALLSATGTVLGTASYDAYGRLSGSPIANLELGFAGGIADAVTGLVRFGARDYDPVTAHWTARDPLLFLGEQTNLYAYVDGDPVGAVDPSGLRTAGSVCEGLKRAADFERKKNSEGKDLRGIPGAIFDLEWPPRLVVLDGGSVVENGSNDSKDVPGPFGKVDFQYFETGYAGTPGPRAGAADGAPGHPSLLVVSVVGQATVTAISLAKNTFTEGPVGAVQNIWENMQGWALGTFAGTFYPNLTAFYKAWCECP
jgi:RHS repeat-associated protein